MPGVRTNNMTVIRPAALALTLFLSSAALAQQSETIEVRITNLDVVVTDRSGNPITGLTQDHFEILEGGKPQTITNFSEVRETTGAPAAATLAGEIIPAAKRRVVVFVDNSSLHPHARTQMLTTLEQSLDRLMRDGDEAMLVFSNGVSAEVLAPLGPDRAMLVGKLRDASKRSGGSFSLDSQKDTILEAAENLLESADRVENRSDAFDPTNNTREAAVKRGKVEPRVEQAYRMSKSSAENFAEQAWRRQKSVLEHVTQMVDGLAPAEGRKVLLFIGGDLSDNPGNEVLQRVDALYAPHIPQLTSVGQRNPARSLSTELRAVAQRANAARVTLYMIDASSRRDVDASHGTIVRAEPEKYSADETVIAMSHVAQLTGGISVPGGKQFNTAIDTIVRDLSSYYSFGYRGQARGTGSVEVRVRKPGAIVRTRQTFTNPSAPRVAQSPAAASQTATTPAQAVVADDSLEGRLRSNLFDDVHSDFPISITTSEPRPLENGRYEVELSIRFPSTVKLVEEGSSLKGRLSILLITANAEGRTSKASTQVQELTFPRGARAQVEAQKTITYNVPLLVGAGKVTVSAAVADQLAGTSGFARTVITTP